MKISSRYLPILVGCSMALAVMNFDLNAEPGFALGADLSLISHLEQNGVKYYDEGIEKPGLEIFQAHGCNYARLRLFVNPDGSSAQINTLEYTIDLAKKVKAHDMRILLNFHYSDQWADPTNQSIPAAWRGLDEPALQEMVRNYTRDTLLAFQREGCMPEMVQIGNEINHGMLWPVGGPLKDLKWISLGNLLKAAVAGVREADPKHSILIMIHPASGGDQQASLGFFDNIVAQSVAFDVIGLTYYPFWNGSLGDLAGNMQALAARFQKDIYVVECGKNWQGDPMAKPFADTPEGQREFFEAVVRTVREVPNGRGKGVFYWSADWIDSAKWLVPVEPGKAWEERALFDMSGNALPAMEVFRAGR